MMKVSGERPAEILHFLQPYMEECFTESCRWIQAETDIHAAEIWTGLKDTICRVLQDVDVLQKQGRKGGIQYLSFSFMQYGVYMDRLEMQVEALDDNFYLDGQETAGFYRAVFLQDRYREDLALPDDDPVYTLKKVMEDLDFSGLLDTIDALCQKYNTLLSGYQYGAKYDLGNAQMFIIDGMDKVRKVIEENRKRKQIKHKKISNHTVIEIDNCSPLEILKLQQNLLLIAAGEGIGLKKCHYPTAPFFWKYIGYMTKIQVT